MEIKIKNDMATPDFIGSLVSVAMGTANRHITVKRMRLPTCSFVIILLGEPSG